MVGVVLGNELDKFRKGVYTVRTVVAVANVEMRPNESAASKGRGHVVTV